MTVTQPHAAKPRTAITADLFTRITRYTRMVFFGKWALGAVSLIIILLIIAIPLIEQTRDGKRISFVSTEGAVNGEHPVMYKPKLEGVTQKNEPFTATAARAVQQTENVVLLYDVQADLFKKDNTWVNLTSKEGRYDSEKNFLELWGDVVLYQDDGYNFATQRVDIDTRLGVASGKGEITGQGPLGKLKATGYAIEDNGARMRFGGATADRVYVTVQK